MADPEMADRVKVIGDLSRSTKVLMPDGTPIPGIRHLELHADARDRPELVLRIPVFDVDLERDER